MLCDMLSGPKVCRRCVEDNSVPIVVINRGMLADFEITGMARMVCVCECVRVLACEHL